MLKETQYINIENNFISSDNLDIRPVFLKIEREFKCAQYKNNCNKEKRENKKNSIL